MIKAREEVSKLTIARMAVYYSALKKMKDEGELVCASTQLGQRTGIASSVIRRDLAYFGGFGTKGVGYEVDYLMSWVGEILGYNAIWNSVFVGMGIPFSGAAGYSQLLPPGFTIKAVVDLDNKNQGHKISGLNLTVHSPQKLGNVIKSGNISIGIIAVPPKKTQAVANALIKAGIKGIANFSSASVTVPDTVTLSQINVTSCLSQLSYNLSTPSTEVAGYQQGEHELHCALG
ncbi:redox-sensing transcriptional repressor Rex [Sporomusa aerivorans]|uniref:redox-sensing transcriptional repressor Rex n=1 Tax=Sporomusa aerivorans TaxID=204936 RepID=UPI00352A894F